MIDHRLEHPWSGLMARGVYRVLATVERTGSHAIRFSVVGLAATLMPWIEVPEKPATSKPVQWV
jgi:hypothetical protein